jgi:excisionase family DNA binding protein
MTTVRNVTDRHTVRPDARQVVAAELLDVHAVAELLGRCSARHVRRLADANRLPAPIRIGRLVRWRRAQLLDWLAAGCPAVPAARAGRQ